MFVNIWEYRVRSESVEAFLENYATDGSWARLFRLAPGYEGTRLLRDGRERTRFVTIDTWTSETHYNSFLDQFGEAYRELDARCEGFTISETFIGRFHSSEVTG